jgi:hypothetical protein
VERRRPAPSRLDLRGALTRQIVGIVLVRNEDLYVEQAIRNVAVFCDRIHVADNMSTDGTWGIVRRLARELDHVDARRLGRLSRSHGLVEAYAGTSTWVFGVDGDELYDPEGLAHLRENLLADGYASSFKIVGNVLNCTELDLLKGTAAGYLAPPSRSITKLYNFDAIESWTDCYQRLHGGSIRFREGYDASSVAELAAAISWEASWLRCLHLCFLPRSTGDPEGQNLRPNTSELRIDRRTRFPWLDRLVRTAFRHPNPDESAWKRERYMRGELVEKDVTPFFRLAHGPVRKR